MAAVSDLDRTRWELRLPTGQLVERTDAELPTAMAAELTPDTPARPAGSAGPWQPARQWPQLIGVARQAGAGSEAWEAAVDADWAQRPTVITLALVVLGLVIHLTVLVASRSLHPAVEILAAGWKSNDDILAGQWWRLVTCCFLHASWPHLILNLVMLWHVGSQVERATGSATALLCFLAGGLVGALVSLWRGPYHTVGASGAVLGLLAAGMVIARRRPEVFPAWVRGALGWPAVGWLLAAALLGRYASRVDDWAHLGGLLGGGLAAVVLPARLPGEPTRPLVKALAVGAMVVVATAGGLALREAPLPGRTQRFVLAELDVTLELPAGWSLAQRAGSTAVFRRAGLPVVVQVTVDPITPPGGGVAAWLGERYLTGPVLEHPKPVATGDDRQMFAALWRPGPVAMEVFWLRSNSLVRFTGMAPGDIWRETNQQLAEAGLSLRPATGEAEP